MCHNIQKAKARIIFQTGRERAAFIEKESNRWTAVQLFKWVVADLWENSFSRVMKSTLDYKGSSTSKTVSTYTTLQRGTVRASLSGAAASGSGSWGHREYGRVWWDRDVNIYFFILKEKEPAERWNLKMQIRGEMIPEQGKASWRGGSESRMVGGGYRRPQTGPVRAMNALS